MMAKSNRKLNPRGTIAAQMEQMERLRASDPVLFGHRFALGDELVRSCANGALRKVVEAVNGAEDDDIFFYFAVKMFHAALINGHIMIANFLLDQGFPLQYAGTSGVPHPLTEAIAVVDDFRAIAIIEFLVIGKRMDVNTQPPPNWLTPLHIAIKRGLFETVKCLLSHGADSNAVAKDDIMPLTLAEGLPTQHPFRDEIVDVLLRKGARSTWRSSVNTAATVFKSFSGGSAGAANNISHGADIGSTVFSTFNPPMQSTMVSFKGGGFTGANGEKGLLTTALSVTVEFTGESTGGSNDIHELLSGAASTAPGSQMKTSFSAHESMRKPVDAAADGKFGIPNRVMSSTASAVSTMSSGATHSSASYGPKLTLSDSRQVGIVGGQPLSSIIEDGGDVEEEDENNPVTDNSDLGFRLSDDGAFIFSTNS